MRYEGRNEYTLRYRRKCTNKKGARGSWVVPSSLLSSVPSPPWSSLSDESRRANAKPEEHKTRGNHKHPCTRERGCTIQRKNIYERRRGAHCYKLTMDSLESSVSTLSSLFLSLPFSHPIVPSDQFPSQADALHSLSCPLRTFLVRRYSLLRRHVVRGTRTCLAFLLPLALLLRT